VFEAHPEQPEGVVAFVCTSAYTTGPGFAGMREYLRRQADWGWIIDLSPEGHRPDVATRVFPEVQQPLCIGVFGRADAADTATPARVRYAAVTGTANDKFGRLGLLSAEDATWRDCPTDWSAPFRAGALSSWNDCVPLVDLMPWQSPGIKPNRTWVYAPDEATLRNRWRRLAMSDPEERPELVKETQDRAVGAPRPSSFDGRGAPENLAGTIAAEVELKPVALRSFDTQFVIADRRVVDRPRPDLWATHGKHQTYLTTLFAEIVTSGPAVTFAAEVPDTHHYMGHHGGKAVPAYRDRKGEHPNFDLKLLDELSRRVGARIRGDDLLAYIAAVTAHPGYPIRFATELRTPGLRIPLTSDPQLWDEAVNLGRRVIWLHTYGERYRDPEHDRPPGPPLHLRPDVRVPIPGSSGDMPHAISFDPEEETLHVGRGELARVPLAVWSYEVSGTQVVKKWFDHRARKPRVRRSSDLNDIVATRWDFTNDLRNLLAVLHGCVLLEPRQAETLDAVLEGPLVTTAELEGICALPPPPSAKRPIIEPDNRLF
jgi:hypothetical protein